MKTVRETVALPDPAEQPLVHPLDLVDARRPFVVSWWGSLLAMPTVVFFLAAVLWGLSNNYVTPIVVPIALAVGARLLAAHLRREAWAYIPRKRQDSTQRVPMRWSIIRSVVSTAALLAGLILLTLWLVEHEPDEGVLGYILGSALGIVILMVGGLVWTASVPPRLRLLLDSWILQSTRLVAVGAAILVGCLVIGEQYDFADFDLSNVLIGAGVIIAIQAIWWLTCLWQFRRTAARSAALHD